MTDTLLGGLSSAEFLRDYWQKKPLFVPQAIPGFSGWVDLPDLKSLACRDDMVARLVKEQRGQWQLQQGPFEPRQLSRLPKTGWALLVQNLNHELAAADQLLHRFDFVSMARLDDVMVSYAPAGGGVGPHFDSYDVFLIQGSGEKRWQIAGSFDPTLVPDAPLRILQNFVAEAEYLARPGDLLYLPPNYAHYGVQCTPGTTYSVGFRVPAASEVALEFLVYLQDKLEISGQYGDPDLAPTAHPAQISEQMLGKIERILDRVQWDDADIREFLGCYLSEPKPHVVFDPPEADGGARAFRKALLQQGVRLDRKTIMLYLGNKAFINGEAWTADGAEGEWLKRLADERALPAGSRVPDAVADCLYEWWSAGYLSHEES